MFISKKSYSIILYTPSPRGILVHLGYRRRPKVRGLLDMSHGLIGLNESAIVLEKAGLLHVRKDVKDPAISHF